MQVDGMTRLNLIRFQLGVRDACFVVLKTFFRKK